MRSLIFTALLLVIVVGCSGGGGGDITELRARCPGGASFCLVSCNLGCAQGGCTISEIAQNQTITLEFSQTVDPASVTPATVSIRTANGEQPVGRLIVHGNKVTFQPEIRVSGGKTLFGFDAGKVYVVSLPGGPGQPQSIRSTSGDPINAAVNCSLTVSQGIVDLDRAPPVATLVAPAAVTDVSLDATIVVSFSELIDISSFQGSGTEFSPILYQVRAPIRDPVTGDVIFDPVTGQPVCDLSFEPVRINGVPRATVSADQTTVVSLRPNIPLPAESCLEVIITEQVKDLSGRSAEPTTFRFLTTDVPPVIMQIDETFERSSKLDKATSSGKWENSQAVAGSIGGDGRHGIFDIDLGTQPDPINFPNLHVFSTNNMVIPAENTLIGEELTVTDGRFFFTEFDLAEEKTLVFSGSNPAQIFVRGRAQIAGTILLNGQDLAPWKGRPVSRPGTIQGQPGGPGGPGASRGGRGGNSGNSTGTSPDFHGRDGEDLQLLAGHAYLSRAVGTGGKGTAQFPAAGLSSELTYSVFGSISSIIAAGGAGGGLFGPGIPGVALVTDSGLPQDLGPSSVPGVAIDLFPLPAGTSSLEHFAVGGSGGGGGGSHPFLASIAAPLEAWKAGAAGTGGGGVFAIRAGGEVRIINTGLVQARGGRGPAHVDTSEGLPAPGGGGSGGSILVQSGEEIVQGGLLDVQGGRGSSLFAAGFIQGVSLGGDGAPGFIRMETPGGTILTGNTIPALSAANSGVLTDTDTVVGSQSLWYPTRQFFAPEFLHYELTAMIDGVKVTYSDDVSSGLSPANEPGGPVQIMFQAARVDPGTAEEDDRTIGPWRGFVGTNSGEEETLNLDDGTGFRFLLIFDRTMTQDIVVTGLSVFFKG